MNPDDFDFAKSLGALTGAETALQVNRKIRAHRDELIKGWQQMCLNRVDDPEFLQLAVFVANLMNGVQAAMQYIYFQETGRQLDNFEMDDPGGEPPQE